MGVCNMKKKEYTKINIIDTNTGIVMTIQPNEYMSEFRFRRVKQIMEEHFKEEGQENMVVELV